MKSDVKDLQIDSHCALFKKNVGSPAIKESEYCHSLIHRKEGDLIGELGSLGFRLRPCVFLPAYYHTTAQHFFFFFLNTFQPITIQRGSQYHQAVLSSIEKWNICRRTKFPSYRWALGGNQMVSTLAIANFGLAKLDFIPSTVWLKVSLTTVLQLEGSILTQSRF